MLAVSSSLRKHGKKYLAVMTLVAVATGINFFLRKVANDNEIFESLYFPIVVASSIFFGVGPGLAASVLSVLALDYFFVEPLYSFGPPADMTGWFVLVSFIATTLLVNRLLLIYQNTRRNLEKSEQRFRWLFDNAPCGYHSVDQDKRILDINNTEASWLGRDREAELVSKRRISDFMTPESAKLYEAAFHALKEEGVPVELELTFQRKDKTTYPVLLRATAEHDEQGGFVRTLGTALDLTEHMRVEEERHGREAAEIANKAKSQFLANKSHELRTPMNGIMGMTDLVLMTELDDKQRTNLGYVKSSAKTLLAIINEILDFSRIEAGHIDLCPSPFNLHDLLSDQADICRAVLRGKPVAFASHLDDKVPVRVVGDALRLNQILNNLLNNAMKFTHEGQITLSVHLVKEVGERLQLQFDVADSGIGIPKDKMAGLFTYFSQVNETLTRKYGGCGLGLAISKSLIKAMDGDIFVKSEEGRGSTFSFTIVLKAASAKELADDAAVRMAATVPAPPQSKILIVEDDAVSSMICTDFCEKNQFQSRAVTTAKEALAALDADRFDLILMDIQLPDQNGMELTKIIRNQLKSRVPIIATTGFALKGQREQCLDSGMSDYVAKPIDLDILRLKMQAHLAKS